VPFLLSAVLIAVGLYVWLHTTETPVFASAAQRAHRTRLPIADLVRRQQRAILLATGLTTGIFVGLTLGSVYLTNYATTGLGLSQTSVLVIDVIGGAA
jgi:hypothetical protein